ncbi:MAG: pantoate--beta-alanine ligase [Candidatus Cloacimonetes bacterium]|nr:pantoate--beta-alanine ligase [Candidatus Cloacimonadota bacterium]MCF7813716.1 pantoate--beta-alanine ligase [Candidatus Cloacimonadota bacterium]MCF7867782.1 pantoate--beta-alanine ligase [Candidatus Cloacimonadota bacterium]MCF7883240.1 pantoate--beta-alanine ligase [Candidatus Cloacimonadota bacterium]
MSKKPVVIRSIAEMRNARQSSTGKVGFVPTMGYLHEGHLSLVKAAKQKSNIVVVSIYVNPTQFGPNEDLGSYPRDFDKDISLLTELAVDYVFFPTNEMMYPKSYKSWVIVDDLTEVLCGKSRKNHFRGVTTIVTKLMNIIDPDFMFMGEKDFQQLKVLQQMGSDLNFRTEIIGCPLIRENDGLAMSSRNKYLNTEQRKRALCLYKSLLLARKMFKDGICDVDNIAAEMRNLIENNDGRIDYIEVIDPNTLQSQQKAEKNSRIVLAVFIGNTRLIDNMNISD